MGDRSFIVFKPKIEYFKFPGFEAYEGWRWMFSHNFRSITSKLQSGGEWLRFNPDIRFN